MYLAHLAYLPRTEYKELDETTPRPDALFSCRDLLPICCDRWIVGESGAKGEGDCQKGMGDGPGGMGIGRGETVSDIFGVENGESDMDDGEEGLQQILSESAVSARAAFPFTRGELTRSGNFREYPVAPRWAIHRIPPHACSPRYRSARLHRDRYRPNRCSRSSDGGRRRERTESAAIRAGLDGASGAAEIRTFLISLYLA